MATFLGQVPQIMEDDEDLADRWLPIWEKGSRGEPFRRRAPRFCKRCANS